MADTVGAHQWTRALRHVMNTSNDDDYSSDEYHGALSLSSTQQHLLQSCVLVACSVSFIGICFIILHHIWARYSRCCSSFFCCLFKSRRWYGFATAHIPSTIPAAPAFSTYVSRDFNAELVCMQAWIDVVSILSRMMGRTFLEDRTMCMAQAVAIHAAGLSSCLWTTCMSFNLYRWIVFGESDKKRRSRLGYFVFVTFAPSILLTLYPLRTNKYGDATFYCFIMDPTLMFVHFYVYYVVLAAVNVVLLFTIRANLKQRNQWHDSISTDLTSTVIRRKALLYIIIFLVHRMPIFFYRVIESVGVYSITLGIIVQFILNLDGFSNAVVYGGLFKKLPWGSKTHHRVNADTNAHSTTNTNANSHASRSDNDMTGSESEDFFATKRLRSMNGTLSIVEEECHRTNVCTSDSVVSNVSTETSASGVNTGTTTSSRTSICDVRSFLCNATADTPSPTSQRVSKKRRFAAGILDRGSIEVSSEREAKQPPPPSSQSFSIFTSTFNMGEQNILEGELVEWIPIGHEIYVIGVQECMNLVDLQTKVLHHLVSNTKLKYIHFSREIGKQATALGYHGYIALTVFVLEEAILEGRFEMPLREAMSKHAQEVFRGKSLLVFGRASNKGAVGISFRYGNTSFAFVTCHLASDSAGLSVKKLSFRGSSRPPAPATSDSPFTDTSPNAAGTAPPMPATAKPPPSKVERRNQDAMEILQQLHLDEEDYGFGFPLLHHHSFVLGDLNYRMNRKSATPFQILDLLANVGQSKSTSCTARTSSGATVSPAGHGHDLYHEVATPTTMRLVPDMPLALHALIREHDELTMLRETSQLFYGFEEPPITFFPTFPRIRGETLQSFDYESLSRNFSLIANGKGYRVPSYTDRILHTSLPGRKQQVQCLYYDSCEAVTTSDHKPVCAVFRVGAVPDDSTVAPPLVSVPRSIPRISLLFTHSAVPTLGRKNSAESACDVTLKVDFRSIQWMDAVDYSTSNLFSRLENVELGFLFPLPCEDVMSHQRKLQEVAEHLNWGESIEMASPLPSMSSPVATSASPNFHAMPWNSFVEQGLRYNTRVSQRGTKHVALLIRTRSRAMQRSASSTRTRSRTGSASVVGSDVTSTFLHSSRRGRQSSLSSTGSTATRSFTSSSSFELSLGHGTFHIDRIGKRQDSIVPLTLGGNLVARLRLRVTLNLRAKE